MSFFCIVNLKPFIMNKSKKYRVRVLVGGRHPYEYIIENLIWSDALDRFLFYVRMNLEMDLSFRCVNIFLGKKCIKMFVSYD